MVWMIRVWVLYCNGIWSGIVWYGNGVVFIYIYSMVMVCMNLIITCRIHYITNFYDFFYFLTDDIEQSVPIIQRTLLFFLSRQSKAILKILGFSTLGNVHVPIQEQYKVKKSQKVNTYSQIAIIKKGAFYEFFDFLER